MTNRRLAVAVAFSILLLCTAPAKAGLHIWTGTASDRFSEAANWIGGSPAGDAEAELLFAATTGTYTPQNDIDGLTVRSLSFSTDGYVLGGKPIAVTREVMATIGESTIACDLVLSGEVVFFVDQNAINVFTALNLEGAIRGSGTFVKDGNRPVWMRGATSNTYSGGTVVRQGYLYLQKRGGSTAIPGDLRIETRAEVFAELPEQISDDAEVTFEAWTRMEMAKETVRSIVARAVPEPHSRANATARGTLFVRESIQSFGNIEPDLDRLHLLGPMTIDVQGGGLNARLSGDASLTIRGDAENSVQLQSTHSSPTTLENVSALGVKLPNSPVVQRGGVFSGSARSLRLERVDLGHATVGGELHLSGGSGVWASGINGLPVVCGGPLTLDGVTLNSNDLYRHPIGTVIPVIRVGEGPVHGTFSRLPEGAVYEHFTITYRGGDGNDVELRALAPPPGIEVALADAGDKKRLTFTVQFSDQLRASGSLALRRDGAIIAVVPLVDGGGSVDLILPPGRHELEAEYSGDAQLAAAKHEFLVTVNAPTPAITSIEPSVIKTGAGRVTVRITGSNFLPDADLYLSSGYAQSVQFISANEIRFDVYSFRKGRKGFTADVYVGQDPGHKTSNVVQLVFEDGPPADPKRLTVTANSITSNVRPGATVAMLMTGYQPFQSSHTVLTDSDNDGRVTWQLTRNLPPYFVCAVSDLATAEYFAEWSGIERDVESLPAKFHRGRTGAYTNVEFDDVSRGTMLWVRAGAGAWLHDFRIARADVDSAVDLFDLTRVQPLGTSPSPVGVQAGDVFVMIDESDASAFAARVDDSMLAPDLPGELAMTPDVSTKEENRVARLTIFRIGGSAGIVSARVRSVEDSAKSGLDFVALDQRVTLEAGEMWKTIEVALIDDAVFAGPRRFFMRLSEPVDIAFAWAESRVHIAEEEEAPLISVENATVVEGDGPGNVTMTVRLTGPTRLTTVVRSIGGSRGTVVFAPGETSKTIDVPFKGNDTADGTRVVPINLSSEQARVASPAGTLTILDDDVAHIFIRDATVAEGGGSRKIELTLDLDLVANKPIRVAWATRDRSATAGADYTAASGTATFSTFTESTAEIEIPLLGDAVAEGMETFEVMLSSPEGAELGRSVAYVTIADDDAMPAISIADVYGFEGRATSMLVYLSAPATQPVTVNVSTLPGTASDADFSMWSNVSQTIPAGRLSIPLSMSGPLMDSLAEPDETFTVVLSNPVNATLGRSTATYTILDQPKLPLLLSIGDAQIVEGEDGNKEVTVTLSLNQETSNPVRVTWSTADGTATAGSDYEPSGGELTFTNGATVTLLVKSDAQVEPDESFTIQLSNPSGATLARSAGIVTITDDDAPPRRRSVRQ